MLVVLVFQRVCSQQRLPQTPVQQLTLYRWAQQALDTDLDCPVLPALWQHFFSLYLARVYDVNGYVFPALLRVPRLPVLPRVPRLLTGACRLPHPGLTR